MVCTVVSMPNGGTAIVCGPAKRCKCGNRATLECDWKVPKRKSGTCDALICSECTTSPTDGKDLCPAHAEAWKTWKEAKA